MYKLIFIIGITSIFPIFAWDGYDNEAGESIEIDKDSLVRKDKDIKVYHWDDGSYHDEEVEGIHENELETYDYTTGEYNYYDMD